MMTTVFQSTPPRRERLLHCNQFQQPIDFNPRPHVGSDHLCYLWYNIFVRFQSTPPRRERQRNLAKNANVCFQNNQIPLFPLIKQRTIYQARPIYVKYWLILWCEPTGKIVCATPSHSKRSMGPLNPKMVLPRYALLYFCSCSPTDKISGYLRPGQ